MKILIADDDPMNLKVLVAMLKDVASCETVSSWKSALGALGVFELSLKNTFSYDLILLDIMMPGMDGHKCLSPIGKLEEDYKVKPGNEVKVAMVSALFDKKMFARLFFTETLSAI